MPPAPERPICLEAAAGGAGGSWYVLLEGLARLVRDVHPWIDMHVVEGGGVMNHANVGAGRIPVAILLAIAGLRNICEISFGLTGSAPELSLTQRATDIRT